MNDAEWTTIGTSTATGEGLDVNPNAPSGWLKPQDLWFAELVTSTFSAGQLLELRAVASDEIPSLVTKPEDGALAMKKGVIGQGGLTPADGDPNIFSGLYDLPNTPILTVRVDRTENGGTVFTPVDNLGYLAGSEVLHDGEPPRLLPSDRTTTGWSRSTGWIDARDATLAPFVVMVAEDGTGAIDEFVPEMNTKIDDNKVWVGEIPTLRQAFGVRRPECQPDRGRQGRYLRLGQQEADVGDAPAPKTEMKMHDASTSTRRPWIAGTNGVAGVDGRGYLAADGYPTDDFAMEIPAGAVTRAARIPDQAHGPPGHAGVAGQVHRGHRPDLPVHAAHAPTGTSRRGHGQRLAGEGVDPLQRGRPGEEQAAARSTSPSSPSAGGTATSGPVRT